MTNNPSGRGKGFGTKAVRALVDLAREQRVSRVVADTDKDNNASRRTLEHAGFHRTGMNEELLTYELDI